MVMGLLRNGKGWYGDGAVEVWGRMVCGDGAVKVWGKVVW